MEYCVSIVLLLRYTDYRSYGRSLVSLLVFGSNKVIMGHDWRVVCDTRHFLSGYGLALHLSWR